MARNYLEELFEKAKQAAQQKAQQVGNSVKSFVQSIPGNLQKSSEKYIPGGIQGGIDRVKQSNKSDYFIFSPRTLNAQANMVQSYTQPSQSPAIRTAGSLYSELLRGKAKGSQNVATGVKQAFTGPTWQSKVGGAARAGFGAFQFAQPDIAVATGPARAVVAGGLGAGINAAAAKFTGKDVATEAGKGFTQGVRMAAVTKFTDPLISKAAGAVAPGASFLTKQLATRGITGVGNVIEDEIIARLDQYKPESVDRAISLAVGAVMGGNDELFDQVKRQVKGMLGNNASAQQIAKTTREVAERYRDMKGRFSATAPEPVRKPKIDWVENPEKPSQLLRTEDGVIPKPEPVKSNVRLIQDPNQPNRWFRDGRQLQTMNAGVGGIAGLEQEYDENGKPTGRVKFNTEKALAGVVAVGAMQNKQARSSLKDMFAKQADTAIKESGNVLESKPGIHPMKRDEELVRQGLKDLDVQFLTLKDAAGKQIGSSDFEIATKKNGSKEARIGIFGIDDYAQGKGFGKELLTKIEKMATEQGASKMNITGVTNPEFWTHMGYKQVADGSITKKLTTTPAKAVQVQMPATPDEAITQARESIQHLPEPPKPTWKESWDKFYTDWVDRFHPIVQAATAAENKVKGMNAELRPEANPKYAIRRFLGVGGIAEQKFRDNVEPILKQLDEQGVDKIDMDAYLKARRDINLGGRGIYGSDPVRAKATVDAFEQKYGPEKLQGIADQLYSFQNNLFDELTNAGFVKPDVAARIKATNADYVPFNRVMDDATVDEFLGIPTKKVVQGTSPVDKRIKGSDRDIYSPIESIIANTYKYTAAIEKNKVAQTIAKLQEVMPELDFTVAKESGSDTIPVWIDGVKQHIKVGKDIADAAKGLNEEQMNNVLKIMQLPAQILRSGATGQNPEFMIPNVVRDQFEAALYSNYGYRPFVDYFRGMARIINKERTGSDEIVDAWMKSGASQELSSMTGRASIQDFFNKSTGKKGLFGWIGDGLEFMGKYSEQPTRVGLFERAMNKTGNTNIAMMESRDATLDFSRMGSKMKVANSIIPFLNVGIQGFEKLIRQAKDKPAQTALKVAIYGLLPQMASTMYNLVNHPTEYAEIPQFEKDNNFVFVSGRNDDGTVNYYTVPKAQSMTNFVNPMENFLSYMAGTNKQSFGEFATAFLSGALPVVGEGSTLSEVGLKTIGQLTPQIIKPAAENLLNKSFFRFSAKNQEAKEIVPYYLKNKAPGDQAYEYTPDAYKVAGKIMNVSPLQVQNIMEGYFAGYTKVPVQIINLMAKASRNEEITPNEVTLLRRFAKQTYPTSTTKPKKQAAETPLVPQANASTGYPQPTPVIPKSGDKSAVTPQDEDNRNWFQKLFNIQPEPEKTAEPVKLPSDDAGLEIMYKDALSTARSYEEKKTKYQYGRYDESTNVEDKLAELEADKAWADSVLAEIGSKHPDKVADFEMKAYKSGAGANVEERAKWAFDTIKKLSEAGETDKVTALIDKMWDEKVLTGGKEGVAQKILDEFGLNVFTYGKDAKKSKDPNAKGTGKSKAQKELEKENKKLLTEFFNASQKPPKVGGNLAQTPKSSVNWGNMQFESPANAADAQFTTKVPKVETPNVEQVMRPKQGQLALEKARALVASLGGGGAKDSRLTLRYAGGPTR